MSLRDSLNAANPSYTWDNLRQLALGDLVRQSMTQAVRGKSPAADKAQLATLASVGLAVNCRAVAIHKAYARCATNGGALTVVAEGVTPATGQIAVAPNGDIVVLAADGITGLDIDFAAQRGQYVKLTGLQVGSNTHALLPSWVTSQGVLKLLTATATGATANTGEKIILAAGSNSGVGTTTKAFLDVTKSNVIFAAADAISQCDVELLLVHPADMDAMLQADPSEF